MSLAQKLLAKVEPALQEWIEEEIAPFRQEAIGLRQTVGQLRQENAALRVERDNASNSAANWASSGS